MISLPWWWNKQLLSCRCQWIIYGTINSSPPGENGPHLSDDTTFSNAFSWMKMYWFRLNFTEVYSQWSNKQYSSIGLYNELTPTIIRTNADLIHWRLYAAQGEKSFSKQFTPNGAINEQQVIWIMKSWTRNSSHNNVLWITTVSKSRHESPSFVNTNKFCTKHVMTLHRYWKQMSDQCCWKPQCPIRASCYISYILWWIIFFKTRLG